MKQQLVSELKRNIMRAVALSQNALERAEHINAYNEYAKAMTLCARVLDLNDRMVDHDIVITAVNTQREAVIMAVRSEIGKRLFEIDDALSKGRYDLAHEAYHILKKIVSYLPDSHVFADAVQARLNNISAALQLHSERFIVEFDTADRLMKDYVLRILKDKIRSEEEHYKRLEGRLDKIALMTDMRDKILQVKGFRKCVQEPAFLVSMNKSQELVLGAIGMAMLDHGFVSEMRIVISSNERFDRVKAMLYHSAYYQYNKLVMQFNQVINRGKFDLALKLSVEIPFWQPYHVLSKDEVQVYCTSVALLHSIRAAVATAEITIDRLCQLILIMTPHNPDAVLLFLTAIMRKETSHEYISPDLKSMIYSTNAISEIVRCATNAVNMICIKHFKRPNDAHDPQDIVFEAMHCIEFFNLYSQNKISGNINELFKIICKIASHSNLDVEMLLSIAAHSGYYVQDFYSQLEIYVQYMSFRFRGGDALRELIGSLLSDRQNEARDILSGIIDIYDMIIMRNMDVDKTAVVDSLVYTYVAMAMVAARCHRIISDDIIERFLEVIYRKSFMLHGELHETVVQLDARGHLNGLLLQIAGECTVAEISAILESIAKFKAAHNVDVAIDIPAIRASIIENETETETETETVIVVMEDDDVRHENVYTVAYVFEPIRYLYQYIAQHNCGATCTRYSEPIELKLHDSEIEDEALDHAAVISRDDGIFDKFVRMFQNFKLLIGYQDDESNVRLQETFLNMWFEQFLSNNGLVFAGGRGGGDGPGGSGGGGAFDGGMLEGARRAIDATAMVYEIELDSKNETVQYYE